MEISFTPLDNDCMAIKCMLDVTARSFLIHSATGTVCYRQGMCMEASSLPKCFRWSVPEKVQAPPKFFANLSFLLLLLNHLLDASCKSIPHLPACPSSPCQSSEDVVRAPCHGRSSLQSPR